MKRYVSITLFLLFCFLQGKAQTYFNNNYEIGGKVHSATSVIAELDGYFVLGQEISTTYRAMNFIRTDLNGDTIWTKTIVRDQFAYYTGLSGSFIKTYDTNYAFGGTVIDLQDTVNPGDALLVKLNAYGDTLWTKKFGGAALDVANVAIQCADSGFVLIGTTQSYGSGQQDFYMVKTDSGGNFQWQKTFGTPGVEEAYSGVKTLDNGFVLSGYQGTQLYLVKTDLNGNFQWQRSIAGTTGQAFVQQFADSSYVVVGAKIVAGLSSQAYIAKLAKDGSVVWQQTYGPAGDQQLYSIPLIDPGNGDIVCSGINSGSPQKGILIKVDSSGNQQWLRTYYKSATVYNDLYDVKRTSDNGFVMTGGTYVSSQDSWLIKVDSSGCDIVNCNVGVEDLTETVDLFKVYPNPASEMATVELKNAPPGSELIVYNALGMEVQREVVGQQSVLKLNTNEWNNGMYFFVLESEGLFREKLKVVISK